MKLSDPDWYEWLQGNPLKVPTFNSELKARIKAQAQLSPVQKSSRLRHAAIIGLGMIAILGLIFWGGYKPASQEKTELSQSELMLGLTDSKWQEVINQKYPDTLNEVLHKQTIGLDRILLFTKKVYEFKGYQNISLGTDLFVWESQKWKWEQSGSYAVNNDERQYSAGKLITAWMGLEHTPLFFGMVIDPQISQIHVVGDSNRQQTAKLIHSGDGNTYWFAALPWEEVVYNVEGLDTAGKILTNEPYYKH